MSHQTEPLSPPQQNAGGSQALADSAPWHPMFPATMSADFIAGLECANEIVLDEQWYPSADGYIENNEPLRRSSVRIDKAVAEATALLGATPPIPPQQSGGPTSDASDQ